MNQAGRDALRAAGLAGVVQIRNGQTHDAGGKCAGGVIPDAQIEENLHRNAVDGCHLCGAKRHAEAGPHPGWRIDNEWSLLCHLNNDHGFDFIGCGENMPVTDHA